jgi:hypothetical protein
MTMEFGLLTLESVLLVATIILLFYSLHEGKRRDHLLKEVARFTKVLTRQEYFFSLCELRTFGQGAPFRRKRSKGVGPMRIVIF